MLSSDEEKRIIAAITAACELGPNWKDICAKYPDHYVKQLDSLACMLSGAIYVAIWTGEREFFQRLNEMRDATWEERRRLVGVTA